VILLFGAGAGTRSTAAFLVALPPKVRSGHGGHYWEAVPAGTHWPCHCPVGLRVLYVMCIAMYVCMYVHTYILMYKQTNNMDIFILSTHG
jgi:hypothetical protein